MTVIQLINNFYKKKLNFLTSLNVKNLNFLNLKPLILFSFFILFSVLFFTISNLINKKNKENKNNLIEVTKTNEFSNLTSYLVSKINSPYEEVNYIIKNNDTIEKILKNYNIIGADIKNISNLLNNRLFMLLNYKLIYYLKNNF